MKPPTKEQWAKWMEKGELPYQMSFWMPYVFWGKPEACKLHFGDSFACDRNRFNHGLICRTKAEAVAKAKQMLAAIKED